MRAPIIAANRCKARLSILLYLIRCAKVAKCYLKNLIFFEFSSGNAKRPLASTELGQGILRSLRGLVGFFAGFWGAAMENGKLF